PAPGGQESEALAAPQRPGEGVGPPEEPQQGQEQVRVDVSHSSEVWKVDGSELTVSGLEAEDSWRPEGPEDTEQEEASLRTLWQSGDLTAAPSILSLPRETAQPGPRRRKLPMQRESGEQEEGLRLPSGLEETDYELSFDEPFRPKMRPSNHLTVRPPELGVAEKPIGEDRFQELLNDLQRENENLRTLCVTLTREKAHLARTVLEMRKKVQSSSQEELTLKLQLDAIREDRRRGVEMGQVSRNLQGLSLEERAQVAEQEAALAKAQLFSLRERFYRIERENQGMADEIHHFREEIGRLRQCSSQNPRCRSRSQVKLMGAIFMFSLLCYWYLTKDNML
ncbi:uncharacterized protein LOC144677018, partial [Cetorhinus maximus]